MLKLYGSLRSRASIVQWYLEELGISYEYVHLDMQGGEHRQQGFLEINPMGKVPAIIDGEMKLWESGAILLYLADKYGGTSSPEQRAQWAQWSLFANATLGPGIFVEANREREMPRLLTPLDEIFSKQPFLLGDDFTVADVAVGSLLNYVPIMLQLDLSAYPNVLKYMQKVAQRPAFQKTIGAPT